MKKSLSLIVAIAMIVSMFATTVLAEENSDAQDNGEELDAAAKFEQLVEAGIFQGHEGGEAALDENMTRAQAAVVISELFGLDTSNPPASPSFSDVSADHWAYAQIEAAADAGIINGRTNGEFDPGTVAEIEQGVGYVSVQELAIMLTLAFQNSHGLSIDPSGTVDGDVAPWAEHYVAAAIEQGLIPEQASYTASATRAQLVEASYEAYEYIQENPIPGQEPATQGIASFEAVGAKKFELVMNYALDEDDKIELVRNSSKADIEIEKSDDMKTFVLTTTSKIREAEYTVTVTADDKEYSETIETEDETVESIEILSDYAPLDRDHDNIVYAFIRISNQYGEDITKSEAGSLTMTASPAGRDAMSHDEKNRFKIENDSDYEYRIGERVTISVVHPDSTQYATAALEVSTPSRVSEIEILELYHPDGDEPVAGEDDEDFYLLVDLLDQYGNPMTASDGKEDVLYTVDFRYVITVKEDGDRDPVFESIDIDGEDFIGLQLAPDDEDEGFEAGRATITLISSTTGNRDSFTVEVEEDVYLDVINLSQPEVAVVGDDEIIIPFEAYDQNGDEITEAKKLNDEDKGVQSLDISGAGLSDSALTFKQNPMSDKAELILDASGATERDENQRVIITAITQTGKVERLTITLRPVAEPEAVGGLDIPTIYAIGATETLELEDIIIHDQYDRKVDMDDKMGDYTIVVKSSNSSNVSINGGSSATFNTADSEAVIEGEDKGRSTFTVELYHDGEELDSRTFSFRTVEKGDISDYEVKEFDHPIKWYASVDEVEDDYKKEVEVKAYMSNGNEVSIPTSFYSVTSAVYVDGNKLLGVPKVSGFDEEETYEYTVVIYADGGNELVKGEVTVLDEASKATNLSLEDDFDYGDYEVKKQSDGLVTVDLAAVSGSSDVRNIVNGIVKVKDQFDVEIDHTFADRDIYYDVDFGDLEEGDDFDVTVSANGNTLKFTIGLK